MWNFALKPEPMKPTPSGLVDGICFERKKLEDCHPESQSDEGSALVA